jgi:hypothetical protein
MSDQENTDDARKVLAELIGVPAEDILHFAIVVRLPERVLAHRFCGMPADGIVLHADAVQSLAANQVDIEASKMALGCRPCAEQETR